MATCPCRVVQATAEIAEHVSDHLRAQDVTEILLSGSEDVLTTFHKSSYCKAMLGPDGKPFALWGVGGGFEDPDVGCVWMVATDDLNKHRITFGRVCVREVAKMRRLYRRLFNYTYSKNPRSVEWLKRLGFNVSNTPDANGFLLFTM